MSRSSSIIVASASSFFETRRAAGLLARGVNEPQKGCKPRFDDDDSTRRRHDAMHFSQRKLHVVPCVEMVQPSLNDRDVSGCRRQRK